MTVPPKSSPHVWAGAHALRPTQRSWLYEQVLERLLSLIHEQQPTGDRRPATARARAGDGTRREPGPSAPGAGRLRGPGTRRGGPYGEGVILLETRSDSAGLSAVRAHTRRRREALEVKIAELAALRRIDEDLARIDSALEIMQSDTTADGRGLKGDEPFYGSATRAARSALLQDLMEAISAKIRKSRSEPHPAAARSPTPSAARTRWRPRTQSRSTSSWSATSRCCVTPPMRAESGGRRAA